MLNCSHHFPHEKKIKSTNPKPNIRWQIHQHYEYLKLYEIHLFSLYIFYNIYSVARHPRVMYTIFAHDCVWEILFFIGVFFWGNFMKHLFEVKFSEFYHLVSYRNFMMDLFLTVEIYTKKKVWFQLKALFMPYGLRQNSIRRR